MKGVVFTELIELVEEKFGWEMAEDVLNAVDLASGGVYTAVGTYPHEEILALVVELSRRTDVPVPTLVQVFGTHLFGKFSTAHPDFLSGADTAFDFMAQVENHIHVEVRKLYPGAELPSIDTQMQGESMIVDYSSSRPFADLAEGLIRACIDHFGDPITLARDNVADDMTAARFTLTRQPVAA